MSLIRTIFGLLLFVLLAVAVVPASAAESVPDQAAAVAVPGFYDRIVIRILDGQRRFHRELTAELRDISAGGGWLSWSLVVASFLYGVFHAAGPGHGKAVLSAYLLSHREAVRRGVALSFVASACQGLAALVVVYGVVWLAGLVMSETQATLRWAERASYAVLVAMGCWLAWRAALALIAPHRHRHGHGGHDHHGHAHPHHPPKPPAEATPAARLMLVLSIGLRPCSGAVIVLVFAQAVGIPWTGILAVAAISLGTGLAVALLALLAVNLRNWAARAVVVDSGVAARIAGAIGLLGGLAIAALGVSLLGASFAPTHPLGL